MSIERKEIAQDYLSHIKTQLADAKGLVYGMMEKRINDYILDKLSGEDIGFWDGLLGGGAAGLFDALGNQEFFVNETTYTSLLELIKCESEKIEIAAAQKELNILRDNITKKPTTYTPPPQNPNNPDDPYDPDDNTTLDNYVTLDTTPAGDKIARTAKDTIDNREAVKDGMYSKNCRRWVDNVFKRARLSKSCLFQGHPYTFRGKSSFCERGKDYFNDQYNYRCLVNQLQPGDWLYVQTDTGKKNDGNFGNHSVVFLGWEPGREGYVARCAGLPNGPRSTPTESIYEVYRDNWNNRERGDEHNERMHQITHISRPV